MNLLRESRAWNWRSLVLHRQAADKLELHQATVRTQVKREFEALQDKVTITLLAPCLGHIVL